MKKAILTLAFLFTLSIVTVSCRDTKKEEKGDIEEAIDDVEDAVEEGVDEVKENTGNGGTDDN